MKVKNMKIKKNNKLIQLQILKSKIYEKKIELDIYKLYFKKIAKIIYEYNANNKKILFLNFSKNTTKNISLIIYRTKHKCIPIENWCRGIIVNQKLNIVKNKFDLIVNQNSNFSYKNINENDAYKIPTITITNHLTKFNTYQIPGNFKYIEKKDINNLFFYILKVILKKAKIKKFVEIIQCFKFKRYKKCIEYTLKNN